ncbi:hypothetical protein LTR04_004735 [Oleoguttula sp. CCFEE 6159]|nr:hypothetical protein LTR04_004735 [Oleoguttula sp. CCFEE 6159]
MCGDQSAGKSSVLEALTEIPFPRNDNLCTRFATEIILRRATVDSLTIKVIPDAKRTADDLESIKAFKELITDFTELPSIVDKAMAVMGIDSAIPQSRAFARDVLSIEIEGPSRPQLTLVDLPGLIQNESKGVTNADVELVRKVDPDGERTLGIITKPDRLPAGSGSESAFLNLARNNDIFFKLGWHVLKNRSFEEGTSSFVERNVAEATYFERSNFKGLAKDCVGISDLVFIPHGAH